MAIHVALHHETTYRYDSLVTLSPHLVRLRPAAHTRTKILSYSLKVNPDEHFQNWQQDPHGNWVARYVFPQPTRQLSVEVDLIAEMTVVNPFDFFIESYAEEFPFVYPPELKHELAPYLEAEPVGPRLAEYLAGVNRTPQHIVNFLVELNQRLTDDIEYVIRLEPGIQTCEETLGRRKGSCRDSAWLLVQMLRNIGLAARFVSGYLIQLKPDVKSLDGPSGTERDFTDLHAWTEVFIPGAGWIGLDPTSGLLAGEGHIPLAAVPQPQSAAAISGAVSPAGVEFDFSMSVTRIHEDPRVTKPYADDVWQRIESLGHEVDGRLAAGDVRLTMGGEPTFVSIDDMEGAEWNTAAVGPMKRGRGDALIRLLRKRFGAGGLLHYGQGKWYPGESLPRWSFTLMWRTDGEPIWLDDRNAADEQRDYGHTAADAARFVRTLGRRLEVGERFVRPAYEDTAHFLLKERDLPINVDPRDPKLKDPEERARLTRVFSRGLTAVAGYVMPIEQQWQQGRMRWISGAWPFRGGRMLLLPGDSPIGLRLPLESLPWVSDAQMPIRAAADPTQFHDALPPRPQRRTIDGSPVKEQEKTDKPKASPADLPPLPERIDRSGSSANTDAADAADDEPFDPIADAAFDPEEYDAGRQVRTALCVEPRNGKLHVFMPPTETLESYLDLIAAIEDTAAELDLPVVVEGYLPPPDPRLTIIKVTPDPGVIEVNVQPAANWDELVRITTGVYEDAREARLATEKFDLDGAHTGSGGGNHVVLGGATPADSPFLRRPDLLRSLLAYWNNHPSLSYLFSGKFIGPTSQAPRVDEGRRDALFELELAFAQLENAESFPPWLVDRTFRNLLTDLTGNTHRAEFCIDKLYSPDASSGRLGLVEFRAFEMPPHPRMSLTQQLLLRALVARFWENPYREKLVRWGTALHDRWLLPEPLKHDFAEVVAETRDAGFAIEADWFAPHFEFRFPVIGRLERHGVQVELREAIEPWYVLGEEAAAGGTARYVDSSVERMQVLVDGLHLDRYAVTVNGRRIPLRRLDDSGKQIAGVRYRAWQPPHCLHPTIPVHTPLGFEIIDTWQGRSLGGCTYHVAHPGGRNYTTFPVNAYEAESRRAARFSDHGFTGGPISLPPEAANPEFPFTLDLRHA
jgi:uncharacterized protein (DUF2126 family)/transglutaminase-like putative cysteine protease